MIVHLLVPLNYHLCVLPAYPDLILALKYPNLFPVKHITSDFIK